jgi:hypothetical protein
MASPLTQELLSGDDDLEVLGEDIGLQEGLETLYRKRRRCNDAIQLDVRSIPIYSNWITAIELCDLARRGADQYKVPCSLSNSQIKL